MRAFAAKPSRRVELKNKVKEMEEALSKAEEELLEEERLERQNEQDAKRLEIVRATIERGGKGLKRQMDKVYDGKSGPEARSTS